MCQQFISRKVYDSLVTNYSAFMATTWQTFSRQWQLEGVWVSSRNTEAMQELYTLTVAVS